MSGIVAPYIVREGLEFYLDASSPISYPGSGNTWYDLSRKNQTDGTIVNATFDTTNGIKSFSFNGTDSYVTGFDTAGKMDAGINNTPVTVEMGFQKILSPNGGKLFQYGKYVAPPSTFDETYAVFAGPDPNNYLFATVAGGGASTFSWQFSRTSWNIVFISFDTNGDKRGFINGNYTSPFLGTTIITNTLNNRQWTIGGAASNNIVTPSFDGKIAYIRIYSRLLSNAETLRNYEFSRRLLKI